MEDKKEEVKKTPHEYEKEFREAGEMSHGEKAMLVFLCGEQPELDYPLEDVVLSNGKTERMYVLPDEVKDELLPKLFPFYPSFKPDDDVQDIHSGKTFKFRDARVLRWNNRNILVCPDYPQTGGMAVDMVRSKPEKKGDEGVFVMGRKTAGGGVIQAFTVVGENVKALGDEKTV